MNIKAYKELEHLDAGKPLDPATVSIYTWDDLMYWAKLEALGGSTKQVILESTDPKKPVKIRVILARLHNLAHTRMQVFNALKTGVISI